MSDTNKISNARDSGLLQPRIVVPLDAAPIPASEGYPAGWMHCKIHLNSETGEMHSDGDHRVRHWIKDRMLAKERPAKTPKTFRERVTAAWKILRHNVPAHPVRREGQPDTTQPL